MAFRHNSKDAMRNITGKFPSFEYWTQCGDKRHDKDHLHQVFAYGYPNWSQLESQLGKEKVVMARLHGCRGDCPRWGTKQCPFGVGSKRYERDCVVTYTDPEDGKEHTKTVKKEGQVILSTPEGYCDDRDSEIMAIRHGTTHLSGLKAMRAESFGWMRDTIIRAKNEIDAKLDERQSMLVKVEGDGIDAGTGMHDTSTDDLKLVEAVKDLAQLVNKYHEKIDIAIAPLEKRQEENTKRLSADDIADAIKKAKAIDVPGMESVEAEYIETEVKDEVPNDK